MSETEISFSPNVKNLPSHGNTLQFYTAGVISLGAGIFFIVLLHAASLLFIVLIIAGILLLIGPVLITWGNKEASKQFVRINHEGVLLAAILPTVVQWRDISIVALSTWTYLGRPIHTLNFVPRDFEAMIARIIEERARHGFSRLLMQTNMSLYRRSHAPSPLTISQPISPIPLDELLTMIQECFASELKENHVTVSGWQEGGTTDQRSE